MNELRTGHCKSMNFYTHIRIRTHQQCARWKSTSHTIRLTILFFSGSICTRTHTHTCWICWERHTHYTYTIQTKWLRRIQVQTERKKTHSVGQRIVCDLSLKLIIMIDLSKCHENSTYLYCVLRAYGKAEVKMHRQTHTDTDFGAQDYSIDFSRGTNESFQKIANSSIIFALGIWKLDRNFCDLNDIHCTPAISEFKWIFPYSVSLSLSPFWSPFRSLLFQFHPSFSLYSLSFSASLARTRSNS